MLKWRGVRNPKARRKVKEDSPEPPRLSYETLPVRRATDDLKVKP
jgi:hypothetical protein